MSLLRLVLPRFVSEGKKYATIAVGCSGGRHRSVAVVEALADQLRSLAVPDQQDGAPRKRGWSIIVMHRELVKNDGHVAWSGTAGSDARESRRGQAR